MQFTGGKRARAREISVTPLPGPGLCTLLEVAGYRILLDCGWSTSLDDDGESAARVSALGGAPLDAVLLSHGAPSHAGGLPFLRGAAAADGAPVYATAPVHRMAQLALYDALLSRSVRAAAAVLCYSCATRTAAAAAAVSHHPVTLSLARPPPLTAAARPPTPTTPTCRWTRLTTPFA